MWKQVLRQELPGVWRLPDGSHAVEIHPAPAGVLSGSFNPLHAGHQELRAVAENWLGGPVFYELTITNADKPTLDAPAIEARCRQFDLHPLWLTNAPTFVEKALLRPGTVFVVGADTALRIVQPRFYGTNRHGMHQALEQIRQASCRFLVAGRLFDGAFHTRSHIKIPAGFDDLFEMLPETEFRRDVSSTKLRKNG